MYRVLYLGPDTLLHDCVVYVLKIVVDVELHKIIYLVLAAPSQLLHFLSDEEVGAPAGNTRRAAVMERVHEPALHREHGRPLYDMVADFGLVDDSVLGLKHLLRLVPGGAVAACRIRAEKFREVLLEVFGEAVDVVPPVLVGRVAPEASLKVLRRGDGGGNVAFPFHGPVSLVSLSVSCRFCLLFSGYCRRGWLAPGLPALPVIVVFHLGVRSRPVF